MKTFNKTTTPISLICLFILMTSQSTWAKSTINMPWHSPDKVQITAQLSQTKVVQNGANTVFLDMIFTPPSVNNFRKRQRATDMIIVLDRSGSMSEAKKMPYAKHWHGLAFVFIFLGVDEMASIHELLTNPLREAFNTSGILYMHGLFLMHYLYACWR